MLIEPVEDWRQCVATGGALDMAEAFKEALAQVDRALEAFRELHRPDSSGPVRIPIDLGSLSEFVLAGVPLGSQPTVHSSFLRTMATWIDDKVLWACQQTLAEVPDGVTDPFHRARSALLPPLFATLRDAVPGAASALADGPAEVPACQIHEMGVGVLLALIAGLLDAGTLRPTGSPVLLMLTPNVSPGPS